MRIIVCTSDVCSSVLVGQRARLPGLRTRARAAAPMEAAALLARLAWCLAGLAVAVPRGAATGTLLRSHTRARNARPHTRRAVGVCMLCHRHDLLLIVKSPTCIPDRKEVV